MLTTEQKELAKSLKREHNGRRAVFVSGHFNIIHPGHLRLINFAKSCGDFLVVGLYGDEGEAVFIPYEMRKEALESLEAVDAVVALSQSQVAEFIAVLEPAAVVKGKEHEKAYNPERDVLNSYGGRLIFSAGEAKFSAIDLLRKEMLSPSEFILHGDEAFLSRHKTSRDHLIEIVKKFEGLRVMVLGDLIVDEYIYCDPLGMSQEDPTIVVTPIQTKTYVGGAGIVAGHVASLGAKTKFLSVVGDDDAARHAQGVLEGYKIDAVMLRDPSRPTILKQRYRVQNKTMLRVSHLRSHDIGDEFVAEILTEFTKHLSETDLVIFSDFNYGALPQQLVEKISAACQNAGVAFVADSQASSQVGDISRFVGVDLASATEREARLAVNDFKSGLQNVANMLHEKSCAKNLFVKLGPEGVLILSGDQSYPTDTLHAMNSNPVDVAGAGDAMLSASSLALAAGATVWESAYLGSLAAAIQVSRVGNIPLGLGVLLAELKQ